MTTWPFRLLIERWKDSGDQLPQEVRWILPLSYGANTRRGLSVPTWQVTKSAWELGYQFPRAEILFCTTRYLSPVVERAERIKVLDGTMASICHLGEASSTVEELELVIKHLGNTSGNVVIVADELHARRVRLTWRALSKRQICLRTVAGIWGPTSPVWFGKGRTRWAVGNIAAHAVLSVLGLWVVRSLRHPRG